MCKAIINRVDLGKRVVGYELYSYDSGEILGLTVSQIKALAESGEKVLGVGDASGMFPIDSREV